MCLLCFLWFLPAFVSVRAIRVCFFDIVVRYRLTGKETYVNARVQNVSIVVAITLMSLAGCKKHVAAAVPTATPVAAAPAAPAPTITLRATPGTLDRGQAATLQWETKNATNVQIQPALGTVTNAGLRSVNPTSSVTYVATEQVREALSRIRPG
jgi:hypothetical protein